MRRTTFVQSLMVPVFASILPIAAQAAQDVPVISFPTTHHDFGKIPPDRKALYRFKVTNTGKAQLNITRLNPSCGCTYTMLGKWSLAPGESTEVEVTFNPAGFRGAVRKSLQVVSNDPVNPNTTLTFEANVVHDISPDTTALFINDMLRTQSRKVSVHLRSGNGKPVQVRETKAPGAPYLSAAVHAEGNDAVLDVTLDGRKIPHGKTTGADNLTVITTSDRTPVIQIVVQWELKAHVVASPDRLAWVEPAGKRLQQNIQLSQVDGRPFRVTGVRSTLPALQIQGLSKAAAAVQNVTVVLGANAKPGTYNENITLTLDDPDQPEVMLRVSAVIR